MSSKTFLRGLLAAAVVATAGQSLLSRDATAAFPFAGACLNQTGCSICCPVCDHVCKLDAEQVDEDIPCFDVESKVICIPRVVFPWQKKQCSSCDSCDGHGCTNCVHNGARVRRVCVLKSDKIKCPKCKYTWSTEKKGNGCDGGDCDSGCDTSLSQTGPASMSYQSTKSAGLAPTPVRALPVSQSSVVRD